MKPLFYLMIFLMSALLSAQFAHGQSVSDQDFDSLGSEDAILKKAKALQSKNSTKIVQKREVDRFMRPEFGVGYGLIAGGDSYLDSKTGSASFDFHFTPRWSLGVRYQKSFNKLTSEGSRIYKNAETQQSSGQGYWVPAVDYPIDSQLAVLSWYPIYGKISWFEAGVSQFDFYLLAGGGRMHLESGSSPLYTAGGGMGVWWNNYLTSRLEVRYQTYNDLITTRNRKIDNFVVQAGIGFML